MPPGRLGHRLAGLGDEFIQLAFFRLEVGDVWIGAAVEISRSAMRRADRNL
jgi:hypothetical protein